MDALQAQDALNAKDWDAIQDLVDRTVSLKDDDYLEVSPDAKWLRIVIDGQQKYSVSMALIQRAERFAKGKLQ